MRIANLLIAVVCFALTVAGQTPGSVRILFGIGDAESTKWDGSLQVRDGALNSLEPWRFDDQDSISGSSWHASTHPIRLFGGGTQFNGQQIRNVVANGIIANLSAASDKTALRVTTAQGNFDVALNEIPYGTGVRKLNGRVFVDRIPPTARLTETPEEEDFPSAASDRRGDVWIAYVMFRHSPDHNRLRAPVQEPITDFARLKTPTGGDQVFARNYSGGKWGEPIAITAGAGDLYRTSVAVDGQGRAWVFWSGNNNGDFDVFARPIENGRPGQQIQISREPGSDVAAVAVTDSKGNVWVAWQGWRNGRAAIFVAVQNGTAFSAPVAVSNSSANEWNPAIAADKAGHVTVAWDSYRAGNYDVYMRTATAPNSWSAEKPVAATPRYEAYPSIAYDPSGRLWVAYEEGGSGWGKDFGAYDTEGVSVYQGRVVRIRGFEADGRAVELATDVGTVLPGTPGFRADELGVQDEKVSLDPDPASSKNRAASRPAPNQRNPRNTSPRLLIDDSGRIWLAFRSAHPTWWTPIGTVWTEYVTSFDGTRWTHPIFLNHSDNLLDNRPALASPKPGQLAVIGSSDGRRQFHVVRLSDRTVPAGTTQTARDQDPYENDLYANEVMLPPATQVSATAAARSESQNSSPDNVELAAIRRLREYRMASTGLRIARGEFHRHSEISMDGGFDGSIYDQWRYILDAASLDWVGCCDHDNGSGREYTWWLIQKLTDIYYSPGKFSPMFNYERSVVYPEGHRNVIFAQRGIRPLPRLPISKVDSPPNHAPDTQMLYAYLKFFNGIVGSHTSGTNMGTDWRDNDPSVEPIVEIYQGDRQNYEMPDAPRSISEKDAIGGWRPKGFVNLALAKGYRLGFEASSDHVSTHISYSDVYVTDVSRDAVLDGLRKRHVYGATDNILADVHSGTHMMGDTFSVATRPALDVKLTGTSKFTKVYVVKDNNYVYSVAPNSVEVSFSWTDMNAQSGKTSYYYVRGEQDDGNLVWVSPMWVTYTGQ
ncbi:MAG: hypothetical protein JOZ62_00660 [Acidobacteriaceae bacterium]|nr:hypothetical protein [Acidobacteriaceae bacterium]